jgi:mRNA interferase YafQ
MREIVFTSQFEKHVKRAQKRGWDMQKMSTVILLLKDGDLQDKRYKDHLLKGNYAGLRECHLEPDWLLVYQADEKQVLLFATGTHADLFK